jgi:DNA-binding NarL/FixJ family response regulator
MPLKPLRVILADRHGLMISGIRAALEPVPDIEIVGEAVDEEELLALTESGEADVLVIDPLVSPGSGMAFLSALRAVHPDLSIIVFSDSEGPAHVESALAYGASGYVVKSIDPRDLPSAIRQVAHGTVHHPRPRNGDRHDSVPRWSLSERERAIVSLLVEGLSNVEIGRCLYISDHTVKYYLRKVYRKLGVTNRTEAASVALRRLPSTGSVTALPAAAAAAGADARLLRRDHAATRRRDAIAATLEARASERAPARLAGAARASRGSAGLRPPAGAPDRRGGGYAATAGAPAVAARNIP